MADNISGGKTGQKVLQGVNLVVYTAVVIAIVVVANVFLSRYFDRRLDLTPNKKYSLAPQTTKLLKGLDRDVDIYAFDREQNLRERRDLLDNYAAASRRVKVHYVDPDRQPSLARQYAVRSYGTIVLAAGDRHYEAQGSTEEGVTNALVRVLKGQKTVYFVQGHGERDLDNTDRQGYSRLKKEFENENYQVQTLVLLQKLEIPSDCSLLAIAGPKHDYLPQEVDTIKKYVTGGGRLLLLLDPGVDIPNLAGLLTDWNVTVRNDLVIDENPIAQIFGTNPSMPLIVKYGSSVIVQPLARTVSLFPLTRSFSVGKDYKSGLSIETLCDTSAESFGVEDFNPKMREVAYRAGKDVKGPLTVALSGNLTGSGEKKTEGRFVAMGTSALAANVYLGFQGNRDLFMNSVNWLSAEEDLISIRPKPPESQHLNMTVAQMRGLLFRLGAVPIVVIVMGFMVWWGRR